MRNIDEFIFDVKALKADELKVLADRIFKMLKEVEGVPSTSNVQQVAKCRKCESSKIIKDGKDKNGKQRYKCSSCGCRFTSTSFSVVSNSHCSLEKWHKYIQLLLNGDSLAECAKQCEISVRTAFLWRHKILNILQRDQDNRVMNGIVEIDDMFFSISYKGNHKNSKKFTMPRPAFKRGTDNRGPIGQKACVMCAVERKGHTYGEVLGIGQANDIMLSHAFEERLLEDTIVVTDKAHNLKEFFNSSKIELIQTAAHSNPRNQNSPPEVKGAYHIQNVNNLHKRLRNFMKNYNGVATKYLNHYVSLYIWIENHKKINNVNLHKELFVSIASSGSYTPISNIINLPELPSVA